MLSHYKERFTHWADPVARALLALRLRPNHLTVLGLGVSVLAAICFARGRERGGAALLILAGLFDFFAGSGRPTEVVLALLALIGTVMVSYTKARAQAIGVACEIGLMERPERLIVLIAGGLFDLMTPALWVLAVLANLTAIQRILYTRRVARQQPVARRQPVA